ncbi:S-acyl fatty acid synthase thioesterase, medium chain [Budorcas taxicolor]|uniref:S-acyl fatty acid synthase thioesterase, medium chain n=1 Tax=Budorcas taxicolor TaxID=37181 RepID=UPI002283DD9F|nr:S-acyl fatty acid synthase thioesterase, medium chain [Budorcas taxicolor]
MERRDKAETTRNEKVVNCLHQNRNALFRLVCFPWGRGGSTYFAKWGQDIPNFVEVHAIRLAGRESRFEEPFASDMHQVVDEIACALLPIIQGENFAFFGHSMGSYTAFLPCDTPSKTRLSCDITCFSGSEDIPVVMEAWKDVTSGSVVLPGRHFYLLEPSNTSFIKHYLTKTLELSVPTS